MGLPTISIGKSDPEEYAIPDKKSHNIQDSRRKLWLLVSIGLEISRFITKTATLPVLVISERIELIYFVSD